MEFPGSDSKRSIDDPSPHERLRLALENLAFASGRLPANPASIFDLMNEHIAKFVALAIAFAIGAMCGKFEIPLPAPPHWFGVLLIVTIWLGYAVFKSKAV